MIGPQQAASSQLAGPEIDAREITGLTADSRRVQPGFLFAALRGTQTDGRKFAGEAAKRGAVAILTDDPGALALDPGSRD
ncbi:MAG: hypothetical protein JO267_11955, partial [Alphaproteobacteria bacterium]|nr:hypothetical protein [Alphaproteobacteria bacterium]